MLSGQDAEILKRIQLVTAHRLGMGESGSDLMAPAQVIEPWAERCIRKGLEGRSRAAHISGRTKHQGVSDVECLPQLRRERVDGPRAHLGVLDPLGSFSHRGREPSDMAALAVVSDGDVDVVEQTCLSMPSCFSTQGRGRWKKASARSC